MRSTRRIPSSIRRPRACRRIPASAATSSSISPRSPTSCKATSSRSATSRPTASRSTSGRRAPFGYDEEYVGDLLFSTNLSFIPVDLQFGPRGDLYVCDWYNPVKGHMQYSLRDERRDRHSGRIWRITAKGKPLQEPPKIAERFDSRTARPVEAAGVSLSLLGQAASCASATPPR